VLELQQATTLTSQQDLAVNLKYGSKERQTAGTKQLHKHVLVAKFFCLICI